MINIQKKQINYYKKNNDMYIQKPFQCSLKIIVWKKKKKLSLLFQEEYDLVNIPNIDSTKRKETKGNEEKQWH